MSEPVVLGGNVTIFKHCVGILDCLDDAIIDCKGFNVFDASQPDGYYIEASNWRFAVELRDIGRCMAVAVKSTFLKREGVNGYRDSVRG